MKQSFKNSLIIMITLLALTFSALGVSSASAAITISDGMAASLVLGTSNFTSAGSYGSPRGVAVDPTTGKVFVTNTFSNVVYRYTSEDALTNGASPEATFTSNVGGLTFDIAVDNDGRLWVADYNRVARFDNAATRASTSTPDGVLGQSSLSSTGSGCAANRMNSPYGVYADANGSVWVADTSNNRILRFDNAASKALDANADGVLGQTDFISCGNGLSANQMKIPLDMFVDLNDTLWVTDNQNNRVLRFDDAASKANGANADGVLGQPDFTTNTGATAQNKMWAPYGVTGDNTGHLYVSEQGNLRIVIFNNAASKANGANADNVIGQTDFVTNTSGLSATKISNPGLLHFDNSFGVLWLADTGNARALMFGTPIEPCPSAITILNTNDSGTDSLRQAIADVCDGGTITFHSDLSGQTITLTSGELAIAKNLTIDGSALASQVTISGNNASRVFNISSGYTVTLKSLTISNGAGQGGGGILNQGALTVTNSSFLNNDGNVGGNAGGAIWTNNTLNVSNSTFSGNHARTGGALAINSGTTTVTNSTFTGNSAVAAGYPGGAIVNNSSGVLWLRNNTFSANTSASGTGTSLWHWGGNPTTHLINNIMANGALNSECAISAGSIGTNTKNLMEGGGNNCGVPAFTSDPLLNALASNGGPTQTMSLQTGSPALNAGDVATCAASPVNNLDQRGEARPQGDAACDIGAYESNLSTSHTVTFYGNGNDGGSMSAQTSSSTANLTANAFTRTGYTFSGWNTQANGSGTPYTNQQSYNFSANLDLYAQWTLNTYTLSYNANGATGGSAPSDQSKTHDVNLTLATNSGSLVKTGYTFNGWNTAANGTGTHYNAGGTYTANAAATLYAEWIDASAPTVSTDTIETLNARQVNATISDLGEPASVSAYGVVYNTTGNPDTDDSKVVRNAVISTAPYSFNIGMDEMGLTPGTQYYVRAFATNATGTSYGSELVVYGTPGAFTVIAPANNATDVSTSPTLSWNASTGATDYQYCVQPLITDCTSDFFGPNWHSTSGATSANLSGLSASTNYVWAVRAVVGTPASYKWVTNAPFYFTTAATPSHTVIFNANGGSGSMSDQSASSATALTANTFTRSGYTFSGWNTAANGSGSAFADGATYNFSADVTLYAQWTSNEPIFDDVSTDHWSFSFIETLYASGITSGCSSTPFNFCPDTQVTRAQMAVLILKAKYGPSYLPPVVGANTGFSDVATDYWAAAWIKQLAAEGITGGCGNGNYCPDNSVTRAQMAVFLLKATHGTSYAPPAVGSGTGFTDVASDYWAAAWIKQLAAEAITGGCGSGIYCPESSVTRAQMAVFLVKAFNLP